MFWGCTSHSCCHWWTCLSTTTHLATSASCPLWSFLVVHIIFSLTPGSGTVVDKGWPHFPLLRAAGSSASLWGSPSSLVNRYPGNFTTDLKRLLRPDVLYITVSQNDEGIAGGKHDVLPMSDVPNPLVLSAGTYGHVPVPLLKQPVSPCLSLTPFSRKYDFVFAGTVGNAPHKMRESMAASIHAYAAQRHKAVHVGRSKSWQASDRLYP